jgi:hypothetical protein
LNSGILLELLAELFQSLLAGEGTTVSRRHVFRRGPNDIAEVDILLSGRFGSSDMKVAVECRDRQEPQGKEWVQQILGKRDDLREFGVRHWIAVSSSGFTEPAQALARRSGLELLVPCDVEPMTPSAPGPHHLLQFSLSYTRPVLGEARLQLAHDDTDLLDRLSTLIAGDGWQRVLVVDDAGKRLLSAELAAQLDRAVRRCSAENSTALPRTLLLSALPAEIDGIEFTLASAEVDLAIAEEEKKAKFRMLTFSDTKLSSLLGFIGLNEFEFGADTMFLLVGFKHGNPGKLVFHVRDKAGAPIEGVRISLDEAKVAQSGYHFGRPKTLRSRRQRKKRG